MGIYGAATAGAATKEAEERLRGTKPVILQVLEAGGRAHAGHMGKHQGSWEAEAGGRETGQSLRQGSHGRGKTRQGH